MTAVAPVLGELFPLAFVIAASPVPIVASILMLLSPRARAAGVGFLVGWIGGILVAVVVLSALATLLPSAASTGPLGVVIKLVLGLALVVIGVRAFTSRPNPDGEAALPAWMSSIDSMTGRRAIGFGFVLAIANPKNVALALAAALVIGSSGLDLAQELLATAFFIAVAALSVAIPVTAYLAAASRIRRPLQRVRAWLVRNNAVVLGVQCVIIGVAIVGAAIGGLS